MSAKFTDNDGRLNWRRLGYYARSAFAVLLSAAVLIGGGWFIYSKANEAYVSWRTADDYIGEGTGEEVQIMIPRGAGASDVGVLLMEADVVKSAGTFRKVATRSGKWDQVQSGRFKLTKQIPAETALDMLLDPENAVRLMVTFPEGLAAQRQWAIMDRAANADIGLTAADMAEAASDTSIYQALPGYANGELEGFLFPSTYEVGEPAVASHLIGTQIGQFNRIAEKLELVEGAQALGTTPRNIVTTASIIAAEVNNPDDQPMVARVIYNRINQGMPLQMDSTVHYAVQDWGTVSTTAEQRANPSPYNTYVHKGYPPGPITNPGESALNAALNPAETDALFFVTVNLDTGETKFAATIEEHNANVAEYQAWCQANTGRC
ncbi:endolytic transglycosylase MltG [Tessaracoccus massiliensis]|uniref:endolytic transglycosylase MltG n=1 Tax=Tessaracoccus massiliensis TaxID=1522311 RepID=UPI000694B5FC|nr:endolytic transglycosylase MltG [Tessaracoccus massiliensis]